jgi:small basic protein (TIGR04137 family)
MTQHTSLKSASVSVKHRNVLKRYERIRNLHDNEKWGERKSVYNLPKLKMIKLKVKKVKEEKPEGEGEGAAVAEGAPKGQEKAKPEAKKKA